jgi:hypothetical protein
MGVKPFSISPRVTTLIRSVPNGCAATHRSTRGSMRGLVSSERTLVSRRIRRSWQIDWTTRHPIPGEEGVDIFIGQKTANLSTHINESLPRAFLLIGGSHRFDWQVGDRGVDELFDRSNHARLERSIDGLLLVWQ